jgi:protein TonB
MFDAVLDRVEVQRPQLGKGTILSIGAHVLVIGLVVYSSRAAPEKRKETQDRPYVILDPPPPPPAAGGAVKEHRSPQPRKEPRKNHLVTTSKPLPETPPEPQEEDTSGDEGGDPYGELGGKPGGKPGGTPGGTGTGPVAAQPPPQPPSPPKPQVYSFDSAKMVRPVLIAGSPPVYPSMARSARVEATVLVKCVITTGGVLQNCRILQGHPLLDDAVLTALAAQRYRPTLWGGQPVNVDYLFTFRFKLE